jgi:predicted MFS family arabinose efflux permease
MFHMGTSVTAPILTLHMQGVGASVFQIGAILSMQALLLTVLRLPLTLLARRVGEKKMLGMAFIAQAAAQMLLGWAPTPRWFYAAPVMQIIATGTFFQLATALNSNLAPLERQGEAMGRHMTIMSIAMFIGPALCSLIVNSLGYRRVFYVSSLFPLLGLFMFSGFTLGVKTEGIEVPRHETPSLGSMRKLFGSRNVVALTIIRTLYSTSNNTYSTLFSLYAVNTLGFDPASVAFLYSVMGVANTAVKVPAGAVSDKVGRKKVLLATFSTIVLVYITLSFARVYPLVAVAVVVFGATWGTRATVEWAFLASLVEPEVKNIAVSYIESFWDLGSALGSFLAGALSGVLPMPTIYLLLAGMNLPALPAILLMEEEDHD